MVPAALEYQSARLPEHSRRTARWLELILDERRDERVLAPREPEPLKMAPAPESPSASSRAAHDDATATDHVVAATDDRSPVLPLTAEEPFLPVSPPTTTRLHATLVTTRRYRDGASVAALRAAAKVIRNHARTRLSANVSNVGGWQSAPDYLMEEPMLFKPLYPLVYQAIVAHLAHTLPNGSSPALDIRLSGWANANGRGHSNALHDHADQDWALSGLLYLEDGGDAACRLTLRNPTGAPLAHAQPAPPLAGQAVVFPSWVQHWVPAHCGSKRRLSVAFNAAVLLPDRRWPDGAPSRALPNLEVTLATARANLEQRRRPRRRVAAADDEGAHDDASYRHELWPLQVTRAHAAPSAAIDDALTKLALSAVTGTLGHLDETGTVDHLDETDTVGHLDETGILGYLDEAGTPGHLDETGILGPTTAKVTVSAATSAAEAPHGLGTCAASALAAGPTPFVPRCCYLALSPPPGGQGAALADALRNSGKVGGAVGGKGCAGGEGCAACSAICSEMALAPLLAPIEAAVRAHLLERSHGDLEPWPSPRYAPRSHGDLEPWPPVEGARVVAGARAVAGGRVRVLLEALAADHADWLPKGKDTMRWPVGEQRRTRPLASGVFFLPSAARSSVPPDAADAPETSVANCSSSRSLIVPDWRTGAAGDLQAHIELREHMRQTDTGGLAAPDGSLFVYPPTVRSFVLQRPRCIATLAGARPSRLAALAFRVLLDE